MEFLVNELSMAGQFHDLTAFQKAVERVMRIRQRIRQHGYSLYCHRLLFTAQVTPSLAMQQAVGVMPESPRRALLQWLTRDGPYWEDHRLHDGGDWLEVDGEVVTDSSVGEAAVCLSQGLRRELVSFQPSSWLITPIVVQWVRDVDSVSDYPVANHWETESVERSLKTSPRPVTSWEDLAVRSVDRCSRMIFAKDAFEPLDGQPFVPCAAKRIHVLLEILDKLKGCFDDKGARTAEGHRIYQNYFTGDNAWFSDSSDSEKRDFRDDLTFRHPEEPADTLFCTWHGKVRTPEYRIHFSWPVSANTPLYVVYVGPKITKR